VDSQQFRRNGTTGVEGGAKEAKLRGRLQYVPNIFSIPLFPDMSASPMARAATQGQDIPTRRVVITSEEDMPTDYSSTPGGTIFGTTPGGTKIVYERAFLVNMRNSPLSRTPPTNLPNIPGVTSDLGKKEQKLENHIEVPNKEAEQNGDDQFSMDI